MLRFFAGAAFGVPAPHWNFSYLAVARRACSELPERTGAAWICLSAGGGEPLQALKPSSENARGEALQPLRQTRTGRSKRPNISPRAAGTSTSSTSITTARCHPGICGQGDREVQRGGDRERNGWLSPAEFVATAPPPPKHKTCSCRAPAAQVAESGGLRGFATRNCSSQPASASRARSV